MPVETRFSEGVGTPDFEVIGSGTIGEKARQLQEKTPTLKRIGFSVPRRTVLADSFFQDFLRRNDPGEEGDYSDPETTIVRGSLSQPQFDTLRRVVSSFGDTLLVVRSSGEGDARGTGVYKSEYVDHDIRRVRKSLQRVWASYFSESAIEFREHAELPEGFGVIIEPMVGQEIEQGIFAPLLSGYGYTSTQKGEGYISTVPGLGGGVDNNYGEKLTREQLAGYDFKLWRYIHAERDKMIYGSQRKSALLGTLDNYGMITNNMLGKAWWEGNRYNKPQTTMIRFGVETDAHEILTFEDLQLERFFNMSAQMEEEIGKPQYFEWAMTYENGAPKYWILQVADYDKSAKEVSDFDVEGDAIYKGVEVTGTGKRDCTKMVFCTDLEQLPNLSEFNSKNSGYILAFASDLTSGASDFIAMMRGLKGGTMKYRHCSNAAVFLELPGYRHIQPGIAHLRGLMDMTSKLYAVEDSAGDTWEERDEKERALDEITDREDGLAVINGKFRVVASERENKMVIFRQDAE